MRETEKRAFEYIVVGCGGIGSAAVYWLSRQAGPEVLGIEQFHLGHERGGSEDHSRIIRLSYHDPAYTALTPHTYEAWSEIEEESGIQLVLKTGGLDLESVEDEPRYINQYSGAMAEAGIVHEELSADEVMDRFPQFTLDESVRGVFQPSGGLVDAGKGNAVHIALARARGATVLDETPVLGVRAVGDGAEVETAAGTFSAKKLVVATGAWTNQVLGHLGYEIPITCTQEQVTYFQTPHLWEFAPERFPVWIWHGGPDYSFYGLPVYGAVGSKAGQDAGGDVVTPDTRTFDANPRILSALRGFLERYIPSSLGPELYTKTCLYDMPPDREFVLGTVPDMPQVAFFCGAGHAFKFAGLIGRILSEIAIDGRTRYPIEAFRPDRPALTDPDFEQTVAM
ncbi:MAG: N-methyl-L-tryptophan oxidase [Rubrobacter sp.]|nr:N-methyl-L-tryptophan oxidase [Rubrobacter sp.]